MLASAAALAEEAHAAQRVGDRDRAQDLWRAAAEADPSWSFPQRSLQLLAIGDARGPEVLEEALAAVNQNIPGSAYLLARLHAREPETYGRALHGEPQDAWLHYGLAVELMRAGRSFRASLEIQDAVMLARSELERVLFLGQLSRMSRVRDPKAGPAAALELLIGYWRKLPREEGAWLDLSLLLLRQEKLVPGEQRAWLRSLGAEVLGDSRLTRAERKVVADILSTDDLLREVLAQDSTRERSLSQVLDEPIGSNWTESLLAGVLQGEWRKALPAQAKDASGRPKDVRLGQVDDALSTLAEDYNLDNLVDLGEMLLAAGRPLWARHVARALDPMDAGRASDLDARARLLQSAQTALAEALEDLQGGDLMGAVSLDREPKRSMGEAQEAFDLEENAGSLEGMNAVLEALETRLEPLYWAGYRAQHSDEAVPDEQPAGFGFTQSPQIEIWPALRGISGAMGEGLTPPGLATLARSMGQFVQISAATGRPLETRMARLLLLENAEGLLLGRPWKGTRVLLGKSPLNTQPWRISGAALPDQYWVRVPEITRERAGWIQLARRFQGRDQVISKALAQTGLRHGNGSPLSPTGIEPGLGEADRVALAVMASLGAEGSIGLQAPSLEALLEVTLRHEEAHLADYAQWLPLGKNLGEVFGILWKGGFSVRGTWARVEARAQLVALCVVPDPRLALVQVLRHVEELEYRSSRGAYPHAEGYAWLLKQLLLELQRNPRGLDPSRSLLHQLHRLDPEDLRAACLVLTQKEGLVGS